ncbi:MAG: MFS transporter, partial [Nitrososphaeraceae archaeon]|nr:MFS transporter [Nitrososphaeraceae archaeon]
IEFMIAARIAQGVGMAMFPIAFGIIREALPEKKLAIGQTIFSSTFSGGAVVGLVGGAVIIQNFGWQSTFLAILPVAIALWLIIARFARIDSPPTSMKIGVRANRQSSYINEDYNDGNYSKVSHTIDIKGTLTLAATIIAFLAAITLIEGNNGDELYGVAGLIAASGASLASFIVIERRAYSPLLDFKIMTSKNFLAPTIILMLAFMSIFMVYLTIPVMVRSPPPFGFGGNAMKVASVQLPFMIVLLIGTIMSGFILNKIMNTKIMIFGTAISTIGFFVVLIFHSTEDMVSVGLTILAAGLSLSITGAFNVILLSVPMQMTGIALGMTLLLNLVGMSVGPALSGVLQEAYKGTAIEVQGLFPTNQAYNLIFITAALVSVASVIMAFSVSRTRLGTLTITSEQHEQKREYS